MMRVSRYQLIRGSMHYEAPAVLDVAGAGASSLGTNSMRTWGMWVSGSRPEEQVDGVAISIPAMPSTLTGKLVG